MKETIIWILYFLCVTVESAKENNIALRKNCSQLQSYDDTANGFLWTADRAVDGCINQTHPDKSRCCSASLGDGGNTNNYWQVDLGAVYSVGKLIVYGRTDTAIVGAQLSGFHVYGQTQRGAGVDEERLYNNTGTQPSDGRYEIIVNPPRNISIVRIERPTTNNIITLCEVQVYEACDDGYFGSNCTNECGWCKDSAPCDKVSGLCPAGCQAGWTGLACVLKENVALNKSASQTSTSGDWTADRAVDGCTNQSTVSQCCSKTLPSDDNTWEVNFGSAVSLGKIVVYGQGNGEDLSGFQITGELIRRLIHDSAGDEPTDGIYNINVEPPQEFTILYIRRQNDSVPVPLTICEVEAFEVCPPGLYGDTCQNSCGQCLGGDTCYGITGKCPRGCAAGWKNETCEVACEDGTFGENCALRCGACLNNALCDRVNGTCPGECSQGYHGDKCDMECSNNTYGFNCNETCGHCFNATQCDVIVGNCSSCDAGYEGIMCTQECLSPNFGEDCLHVCNCANNVSCNHVAGLCPGGECAAGWQGQSCNQECQNFTFGPNCLASCGHCANGSQCDPISGICELGCAPGWLNATCNVSCDFGNYGINCTGVCGHCRNNETCLVENGTCRNGCAAGWQGDTCNTECSNGTYGPACIGRCYCANREPCDKVTGVCPAGCDIGIVGDFCHIDLNRAINKTANQSSTWNSDGFLWKAERAIDGNFLQSGSARTCSATEPGSPGWWFVDMESVTRIEFITVYCREETSTELAGFKMYLQNTTDIIDMATIVANTSTDYDSVGIPYNNGVYNISFDDTRTARYIIISRQNAGGLSLCEVRVFGECRDGTFGLSCDGVCYCKDAVPCNKETGQCPAGCAPGWNGTQCSHPCSSGTYGTGCSGKCGACANATSCDVTDGVCSDGCSDGWLSSMCNISCSAGMYGANCSSKCGQCKGGPCNHMTGMCDQGCLAGFHGNDCQTSCSNGTYGENCRLTCGSCANENICSATTGHCPHGCKDGLVPPLCANAETQTGGDNSDDTNVGAIVGGVFGGVAFVIIIGVVYKLCTKRSKLPKMDKAMAYYPSMMAKETRTQPTGAVNSGYSMEEGTVNYYNFDSSTRL